MYSTSLQRCLREVLYLANISGTYLCTYPLVGTLQGIFQTLCMYPNGASPIHSACRLQPPRQNIAQPTGTYWPVICPALMEVFSTASAPFTPLEVTKEMGAFNPAGAHHFGDENWIGARRGSFHQRSNNSHLLLRDISIIYEQDEARGRRPDVKPVYST